MGQGPKAVLELVADKLPDAGVALDVGCGEGQNALWLAERGLIVVGLDISEAAIAKAEALAEERGHAERTYFFAVDLDAGLPEGLPAEFSLITSLHFRPSEDLMDELVDRVAEGGQLLIEVLTDANAAVDGSSIDPRFLAGAGEVVARTMALNRLWYREGKDGERWIASVLAENPVDEDDEE